MLPEGKRCPLTRRAAGRGGGERGRSIYFEGAEEGDRRVGKGHVVGPRGVQGGIRRVVMGRKRTRSPKRIVPSV